MLESQPHTCRLLLMPSGLRGDVPWGMDLLEAARSLGVDLESLCGGRQTCGKCQIVIEEGYFPKQALSSAAGHANSVEGKEATYWERQGKTGRRLACATRVLGDLLVSVPEESQARKQVIAKAATDRIIEVLPAVRQVYVESQPAELDDPRGDWERLQEALATQWGLANLVIDTTVLPFLQTALRKGQNAVTVTLWQDREVLRIQPGYSEGAYGLAIDVGSTTLVAHLCDLRTGQVMHTEAMMNPQVRYGEDLMSRVSYGMMEPNGVERLHGTIIEALNTLAQAASKRAGIRSEDILDIVLVGNSVMHHLMLGIDPVELGGAPFALATSSAVDMKARD